MANINCVIIHGCPSDRETAMNVEDRTYDKHWIPWVRERLIAKGIQTETPLMPEPWSPVYEKFKEKFETLNVGENTVLVGHSCGCAFLVRWLGDTKREIKKLILVAPWKANSRHESFREKFYGFSIDETIKYRVKKVVMFTSDNEGPGGPESLKTYYEALGGEIISLPGRGHFISEDMGTVEFPELVEQVVE